MTPSQQRPIATSQIGAVRAAVWRNHHDGKTFYNTTLERVYRDGDGEVRSSASFGRDDLLALAKVADLAHTMILDLQAEAREQDRERASQQAAGEHAQGAAR